LPLFPPLPHVQVVQASAGAGKTYSLGLRFLQLLARSGPPSAAALGSILALTFTVAAAQEMKTRIIAFLKNIALQTPTGTVLSEQSGLQPSRGCRSRPSTACTSNWSRPWAGAWDCGRSWKPALIRPAGPGWCWRACWRARIGSDQTGITRARSSPPTWLKARPICSACGMRYSMCICTWKWAPACAFCPGWNARPDTRCAGWISCFSPWA